MLSTSPPCLSLVVQDSTHRSETLMHHLYIADVLLHSALLLSCTVSSLTAPLFLLFVLHCTDFFPLLSCHTLVPSPTIVAQQFHSVLQNTHDSKKPWNLNFKLRLRHRDRYQRQETLNNPRLACIYSHSPVWFLQPPVLDAAFCRPHYLSPISMELRDTAVQNEGGALLSWQLEKVSTRT